MVLRCFLRDVEELVDDFGMTWMRRPRSPFNFQHQAFWEVLQQFKEREHVLSFLILANLLLLLCLGSASGDMCQSKKTCARTGVVCWQWAALKALSQQWTQYCTPRLKKEVHAV